MARLTRTEVPRAQLLLTRVLEEVAGAPYVWSPIRLREPASCARMVVVPSSQAALALVVPLVALVKSAWKGTAFRFLALSRERGGSQVLFLSCCRLRVRLQRGSSASTACSLPRIRTRSPTSPLTPPPLCRS